jgi:hypothetical protein
MSYRSDLEALRAHLESTQQELAEERDKRMVLERRLAQLEVAAARRPVEPPPAAEPPERSPLDALTRRGQIIASRQEATRERTNLALAASALVHWAWAAVVWVASVSGLVFVICGFAAGSALEDPLMMWGSVAGLLALGAASWAIWRALTRNALKKEREWVESLPFPLVDYLGWIAVRASEGFVISWTRAGAPEALHHAVRAVSPKVLLSVSERTLRVHLYAPLFSTNIRCFHRIVTDILLPTHAEHGVEAIRFDN